MINGYVLIGYALIWISLLAYAWRTSRRLRAAERELARLETDSVSRTVDA
ncbi:MAG: CcmD family protein [Gemmatimonadota bacterium]